MDDAAALRLFLAIELPDAVRAGLDAAAVPARAHGTGVRWVRAESLHLTLVFLGERPARQVDAIAARVGAVCAAQAPFALRVEGMGCFPSPHRPRVLWAGIGGETAALKAMQCAILGALVRAGLAAADERFDPHLTLGRVRDEVPPGPRAALGHAWTALPAPALPPIAVRACHLMRSELGRGGALYTALRTFPLAGAP
jgi:2'-5' RNA ligase